LGHFTSVNRNFSWEFQGHSDSITFDARNPNDPDWIFWITDHNFFGFTACDDKHDDSPPADQRRSSARG
jgi:hypothetical protein